MGAHGQANALTALVHQHNARMHGLPLFHRVGPLVSGVGAGQRVEVDHSEETAQEVHHYAVLHTHSRDIYLEKCTV